jgi:hypothetical protein
VSPKCMWDCAHSNLRERRQQSPRCDLR